MLSTMCFSANTHLPIECGDRSVRKDPLERLCGTGPHGKLGKPCGPSTEYQYAPSLRTTAPTVREMMRMSSPMDQLSTYEMS
ncbi:hypothetical protein MSTE_00966 [Mycobacteroides stephanolepidis]|uniref:Uncharacterized protein n=1 Tax=[Mycobacterium] stephanolepidis TaxID=1520670 RepID=A0A1Z4ETL1_9MYCO|nr:hypothetical protein MSTE_00966 [[Mycobacterium] stephanolepidis]